MALDLCSILVFVGLVINSFLLFCHGGTTSSFVRKLVATVDMPLHSDVFCVPPGNNAPQQVHITQGDVEGDGGNLEGLATKMTEVTEPQPKYSAFREASFGHAVFSIRSRTHAYYSWHRNQDGYAVKCDTMWFYNRFRHPIDDSPENLRILFVYITSVVHVLVLDN